MVDIVAMVMGTSSKEVPIVRFEVWWQSALGLVDGGSRELAIQRLKDSDLDPALNMIPICVAISEDGQYEIIGR